MAYADYKLCDVCGAKAFYDLDLIYEDGDDAPESTPYRVAGKEQYEDPALNQKWASRLGYLGDWAVICEDCAKTHKTLIVPIDFPAPLAPGTEGE